MGETGRGAVRSGRQLMRVGRLSRLARARARVGFEIGRGARAVWGFAVVTGFGVLLAQGWFQDLASTQGDGVRAAAAACLIAVLVAKVAGRLRTSERRRSAWRENVSDIELGLLLLTATYVFLAALG